MLYTYLTYTARRCIIGVYKCTQQHIFNSRPHALQRSVFPALELANAEELNMGGFVANF